MYNPNPDLVALGRMLKAEGYEFASVSTRTRERVINQERREARTLRDIFGWNKTFQAWVLPSTMLDLLARANAMEVVGDKVRSKVGFSTLGEQLFVHRAFSAGDDSPMFGPDAYRFCNLLERSLGPCSRLVDLGCGSGVGGLFISGKAQHVTLTDSDPTALEFAAVNAALSSVPVAIVQGELLEGVEGPMDAVIASPPFAVSPNYPQRGEPEENPLAARLLKTSLARLQPGGTLVLSTKTAIIAGQDAFKSEVVRLCGLANATFDYHELDPDVCVQVDAPYVERIAAVALVAKVPTYSKQILLRPWPGDGGYLH